MDAEQVMLQMTADGQQDQSGNELEFYGVDGSLTGSYVIPGPVAHGQAQRTILLGSPETTPTPDFDIGSANRLDPAGGGVCFVAEPMSDCVTWGAFPATLLETLSNPNLDSAEAILGDALGRLIEYQDCPTWLGPFDDTDNGLTDFRDGYPPPGTLIEPLPPVPRNNSTSPAAASPSEVPCQLETQISKAPANPTNDVTPTFDVGEIPAEYATAFECRFSPGVSISPAVNWAPCPPTGNHFGPLADGFYTFEARVTGYAGTDPTPLSWTFEVDTVPPDTAITAVPPDPSSGFSASFAFASTEPHSTFVCQFESGPIQPCQSPKTIFGLADGTHAFRVWAIDQATNKDPTPVVHLFNVDTTLGDTTPPETTLLQKPPNPSQRTGATFGYRSSEPRSTFQCRLDDAPFAPCPTGGISYQRLRNGTHTFRVRAIDRAGNTDPVPDSYAWRVSAALPRTRITGAPPGAQRFRKGKRRVRVRFAFRSSKPGSQFRCRLDRRPFRRCRSPRKFRVGPGRHRFEVYAIDSLGNEEPRPTRRIFRVLRRGSGFFGARR